MDRSITQLKLKDFRNYSALDISFNKPITVITGHNGSGKTNLLEAISLLTAGRGLRNANLGTLSRHSTNQPVAWSIFSRIQTEEGEINIATGKDNTSDSDKRIIKHNGEKISSQHELGQIFSACWITPQMDQIFSEGATSKRHYLDKLVELFYPDQRRQISIYNHARSERTKLLTQNNTDHTWLTSLENRMAEQAVAIAAARIEVLLQLQNTIDNHDSPFPKATLTISGITEDYLRENTALKTEQFISERLKDTRPQDRENGRTFIGTHRSNFNAIHSGKNQPAELCSTGEQKALLLCITLATISAQKTWSGNAPILLLDEVVAHLDEQKRGELFAEIYTLNTQTFLTGTDPILFEQLKGNATFLSVENGVVSR